MSQSLKVHVNHPSGWISRNEFQSVGRIWYRPNFRLSRLFDFLLSFSCFFGADKFVVRAFAWLLSSFGACPATLKPLQLTCSLFSFSFPFFCPSRLPSPYAFPSFFMRIDRPFETMFMTQVFVHKFSFQLSFSTGGSLF